MNCARLHDAGGVIDPGFIEMAFTIHVGSVPPPSENSSPNEPPLTETLNVLTANPPNGEFTLPKTVVPLAFTIILSWAKSLSPMVTVTE